MSDYETSGIAPARIYIQSTLRGHDALIELGERPMIRLLDVQVFVDGSMLTGDPMSESESWRSMEVK